MKVAFLLAHMHKGGMQKAVSNITRALPAEIEQYVAYFGSESPGFPFNAQEVNLQAPGSMTAGILRKIKNGFTRLDQLKKFVQRERIDIVVSFGETASIVSLLSGHDARSVVSIRVSLRDSLSESKGWGFLYRVLIRLLYPRADAIVPCSIALGEEVARMLPSASKIVPIPNLYHHKEIESLASQPLSRTDAPWLDHPTILSVGSLNYQKGQDLLLAAFSKVKQEVPTAKLVLVGQGPAKHQLIALIGELGLKDDVHLVDFNLNPYRLMRNASVFALCSRYEGFPNVLVEALICGCPTVAFDCPTGPREILEDSRWGILVETGNVPELAKALIRILTDPEVASKYAKAGQARAACFDSVSISQRWMNCFRELSS